MSGIHHQVPLDGDANCQSQDQSMVNAETQSTRQLHVLNLPNEILRLIFKYVRGESVHLERSYVALPQYSDEGINSIKQARLVCHDFCDLSSHLLLHAVSVSMKPSSLAHLDQVSRHPTISKGVNAIVVNLSFFANELAQDFSNFVAFQQIQLQRLVSDLTHDLDGPRNWPLVVRRSTRIWLSWEKYWSAGGQSRLDQTDEEHIGLLRYAHTLYRQAWVEQVLMQTDGSFIQAITDAVTRMPAIKFLYAIDVGSGWDGKLLETPFPSTRERSAIITALAQPMTWRRAWNTGYSGMPINFLTQIPLAIHRAGVTLRGVHYGVNFNAGFENLIECTEDRDALKYAMRHLKSFKYGSPSSPSIKIYNEDDLALVKDFLDCFTDTDSLEDLTLDVALKRRRSVPDTGVGCLLLTGRWSRLKLVTFSGSLHAKDLESFYANTRGPVQVQLRNSRLLSGTWHAVVESMRAKAQPLNRQSQSFVSNPAGGEIPSLPRKQRIFFQYEYGRASWQYIHSFTSKNPMNPWEEQAPDDALSS